MRRSEHSRTLFLSFFFLYLLSAAIFAVFSLSGFRRKPIPLFSRRHAYARSTFPAVLKFRNSVRLSFFLLFTPRWKRTFELKDRDDR